MLLLFVGATLSIWNGQSHSLFSGWLDRFALGEIQFFPGLAGLGTGLGSRAVFRDCQRCNRRLKLYP